MALRAVQEFFVHVESFRNIDLWYQGAYLLRLQIYLQGSQKERVYAHPFAHTRDYQGSEEERGSDPSIIKEAFIHTDSSSFCTKAFLLRYYEEEVQLNDMAHFRVETDISLEEQEFTLEATLLFYDQQIKKIDPEEITVEKGKTPKTKRFLIRNSKSGIHQFVPVAFDGQYFSLANLSLHSVCLDYRFRVCPLQLFQFSRMGQAEKKKLLEKNQKMQPRQPQFAEAATQALKGELPALLGVVEEVVVRRMKKGYQSLLKEYRVLFTRVVTEIHKQLYASILVHPSQLSLFEEEALPYKGTEEERIFRRYRSKNSNEVIENMLNETNLISGELLKLWHHYIDLLKINPRFATAHLEDTYAQAQQKMWNRLRRLQVIPVTDHCVAPEDIDNTHQQIEKELMAERSKLEPETNVVSEDLLAKRKNLSLIIEDTYSPALTTESESQGNATCLHLAVLVHGFQGNSLDMKLIKNNFSLMYPQVSFLCASSNEDMTDTDIIEMGNRLATEVRNHINEFFPPDSLQFVSFIGHSLGGVIIRAALPRLLDMRHKFHSFLTFSSPHLGYKVNTSSVIEAGIWVLQKFKNSNCLKQLTMADSPTPKDTCLYRISKFEGLKHFRHIFLFSSRQDSYAPYESARIEIHPDFMSAKDPLKDIHCEMVRNILGEVRREAVHRVRVSFTIEETNLDSLIGRTAHILFLENHELMQLFLHSHPQLLE